MTPSDVHQGDMDPLDSDALAQLLEANHRRTDHVVGRTVSDMRLSFRTIEPPTPDIGLSEFLDVVPDATSEVAALADQRATRRPFGVTVREARTKVLIGVAAAAALLVGVQLSGVVNFVPGDGNGEGVAVAVAPAAQSTAEEAAQAEADRIAAEEEARQAEMQAEIDRLAAEEPAIEEELSALIAEEEARRAEIRAEAQAAAETEAATQSTLTAPPDVVQAEQIALTTGQQMQRSIGDSPGGPNDGAVLGANLQIEIVPSPDGAGETPTQYRYEIERADGAAAPWRPIFAGTTDVDPADSQLPVGPAAFDPLLGYSDHPDGMNNGEQWIWRVRVKAVNDGGESEWSPWVKHAAELLPATVEFEVLQAVPCGDGADEEPAQCLYLSVEMYGFAPNGFYRFGGGTDIGELESRGGISTQFAGCIGDVTTDERGRSLPPAGDQAHHLYCSSARHAEVRLVTADGRFSAWVDGLPE